MRRPARSSGTDRPPRRTASARPARGRAACRAAPVRPADRWRRRRPGWCRNGCAAPRTPPARRRGGSAARRPGRSAAAPRAPWRAGVARDGPLQVVERLVEQVRVDLGLRGLEQRGGRRRRPRRVPAAAAAARRRGGGVAVAWPRVSDAAFGGRRRHRTGRRRRGTGRPWPRRIRRAPARRPRLPVGRRPARRCGRAAGAAAGSAGRRRAGPEAGIDGRRGRSPRPPPSNAMVRGSPPLCVAAAGAGGPATGRCGRGAALASAGWAPARDGDGCRRPARSRSALSTLAAAAARTDDDDSRSRRTSSSAARISAADSNRRVRSFSIARAIRRSSASGTLAFSSIGAGGSRLRMASNTTAVVAPWNVCWPVAIS